MTELVRESAQWRKGKTPLVAKYAEEHAKMMTEIAGRGFLSLPGYAYDLENQIETLAKLGLSELNYKILTETVEREIKQSGITYDLSYKTAVIAWEVEKQVLMNDWAAEYAGVKQGMELAEDVLNRLSIEVGKRAILLLEGKSAIEIEMEGYRKSLAVLDGTIAPFEVQLAEAKLRTAERKMLIIPILEEINGKELELLIKEQGKADAYGDFITAEQELSQKKQTLTPFLNDLAAVEMDYATQIISVQLPTEALIAAEKVIQAEHIKTKADSQVEELNAEIETEGKRLTLLEKRRDLEGSKFEQDQEVFSAGHAYDETYHDEQVSVFDNLLTQQTNEHTQLVADKREIHTNHSNMKKTSVATTTGAENLMNAYISLEQIRENDGVATANAAAKITASLEHLIG